MAKLKNCPFCGKPPRVCPDTSYGNAMIFCPDFNECPVSPAVDVELSHGQTVDDAITAWNTRTSEAKLTEAVEVMRPFADVCAKEVYHTDTDSSKIAVKIGHLRAVATFLASLDTGDGK